MKSTRTASLTLGTVALALLTLTGCSSALTGDQVDSELTVSAPVDTLLRDPVTVEYTGSLADKRTDSVVIRIQSSVDGTTWTTVEEVTDNGPELAASYSTTAMSTEALTFRTTISASPESTEPLAVVGDNTSTTVLASDINELIRTFYYDRTTAFQQSPAAGIAWVIAHESPIYDQEAPTFVSGADAFVADALVETSVPDLTTISPDPTWMLSGATSCNPAMTSPPEGRTYVVTVAFGGSYGGYPVEVANYDVHVTLTNGKLVEYSQICDS